MTSLGTCTSVNSAGFRFTLSDLSARKEVVNAVTVRFSLRDFNFAQTIQSELYEHNIARVAKQQPKRFYSFPQKQASILWYRLTQRLLNRLKAYYPVEQCYLWKKFHYY